MINTHNILIMFSKAKKKGLKREDFLFENGWF